MTERFLKFPLIFTNDDVGAVDSKEHIDWFNEVIELLEAKGIKGTFFWVPKTGDVSNAHNHGWMKVLKDAIKLGHDVQLHGLTHDCLGFGLPQGSFREENKPAFEAYENDPEKYQLEWTIPKLKVKLEEAINIYEEAFGKRPLVFRAPCVGASDAMYEALREVGIYHSSSRVINPKSWLYTMSCNPIYRNWQTEFSPYPYTVFGVREYPIMSDYTHWGISEDHYGDILNLAKDDYTNLLNEGREVGIMVSHYHSMHKNWELSKRFYNELLDYLQKDLAVTFVTFKDFIG